MSIRKIVLADDPLLRKKARRIQTITKSHQTLVDDMVETMHAADGVGLAGPQVGVPERLIVAELPEHEDHPGSGKLYVLFNPEIVRSSPDLEEGVEGCLSIPGWQGLVDRAHAVTVQGQDRKGKPVRIKARGMLARVLQHEVDHLDGILYIDRITDPEKIWRTLPPGEESAGENAAAGTQVQEAEDVIQA